MMNGAVEHRKRHHSDGDDDPAAVRRVRPLVESGRMSGSLPAGDGQRPVEHNAERGRRVQLMPSPPDSECSSSDDEDEEAAGPDHMELAGFEYCAREAIRYLVEEERLDAGHPMVRQLRQRLFADAQDAMDHPPDASGPRPSDDAAPRQ